MVFVSLKKKLKRRVKLKNKILQAFGLSILIMVLSLFPIMEIINNTAYNQKFIFRGVVHPSNEIVILTIDDESISWMSKWPWPRSYHAKVISELKKAGAKLVVFDVFFDSPTQFDDQDDISFANAVKEAGNVVLAASFVNVKEKGLFKVVKQPFKKPIQMLSDAAVDVGVVHPALDLDNIVRRFQIIYKSGNQYYASLALQAIRYTQSGRNLNVINENKIQVGDKTIPLRDARLLINYYGPSGTFSSVPYVRVYDGTQLVDNPDIFRDKIVLIGSSAYELHDVFPTPYDLTMPGVEIHANVIQTILDKSYISVIPIYYLFLIIFLLILLNIYISYPLKIKTYFFIVLAEIMGVYVALLFIFKIYRLEIPSHSLSIALIVTFVTQTVIKFIKEEKEKKKVRSVFSQYVAPSVVNELLNHPETVELGGTLKEVTIFFSDIRSFTSFSENHTPREVVDMLNEYLDAMTKVIFEYGGTLDKYVGDEIMAIFGAPLDLPNHAKIAIDCCVAQLKKLKELQKKWADEGKTVLDIGMGLNTGEVIVGNIGSSMHKDYTVIGDPVNLAARLESATRNYTTADHTCYILISEYTYDKVKEYYNCKFVDEIAVKGKKNKTKIYEIIV